MTRFLLVHAEGAPFAPILRELGARGHEVRALALPPARTPPRGEGVSGLRASLAAAFLEPLPEQCRRLVPVFRESAPDVVVTDLASWAARWLAEDAGAATVLVGLAPWSAHPLPAGAPAWQRAVARAAELALWHVSLRALTVRANRLRRGLGLPRLRAPFGRALLACDLHLQATTRAFEAPGAVPAHVRHVGPLLEEAEEAKPGEPPPDVLVVPARWQPIHEALARGVPIVALAGSDEERVLAGLVDRSGAGVGLRSASPGPEALGHAVERVRADAGFAARARAVREDFARHDAPRAIADLLEAHVRGRGSRRPRAGRSARPTPR